MAKFKVVLFGLYNTLISTPIDSNPYERVFTYWGRYRRDELSDMHKVVMTENIKDFQALAKRFNADYNARVQKVDDEMREEVDKAVLLDGTGNVLRELRGRGYVLGLISNLATPYIDPVYKFKLDKLVDHMIFSCELGCLKPSQTIFFQACALFGAKPAECIMVGAGLKADYIGARQAGLSSVLFDPHYNNPHLKNRIDDIASLPDLLDATGVQIK